MTLLPSGQWRAEGTQSTDLSQVVLHGQEHHSKALASRTTFILKSILTSANALVIIFYTWDFCSMTLGLNSLCIKLFSNIEFLNVIL